jgi:hypothetical protein
MSLGQFIIKTYLKGNLITARDGGGHNRDALVTSATTVGPNEIFQLETEQPDFIIFTTSGGDWVAAVDGGGATAAAAAFDTTGRNLTDFVLFRIDGPRGNGAYDRHLAGEFRHRTRRRRKVDRGIPYRRDTS